MSTPIQAKQNKADNAVIKAYSKHLNIYRISLLFFAILFPTIGFVINTSAPLFYDPFSYRIGISLLFLALWISSYTFSFVVKKFFIFLHSILFIIIIWGVYIAYKNQFAFSASLIYIIITSTVALSFRKASNVAIYSVLVITLTAAFLFYSANPFVDKVFILVSIMIFNFLTYMIIKSKYQTIQEALVTDEKFELLVMNIDEGIMTFDDAFNITFTNAYSERILYFNKDQIIGKSFFEIVKLTECRNQSIDEIKNKILNGDEFEIKIMDSKEKCKTLNFYPSKALSSIINNKERMYTYKDITQKQAEKEELKRAKEKAEESDRLKTAFLANMSHEIRTPMNSILGFAQLLNSNSVSETEQKEYLQIIDKSGKRMLGIINDLINISKIESGQMTTTLTMTNISEQLTFIYNFFQLQAKENNIGLKIHLCPGIRNKLILTDTEKFYAILINLVKNAIKFTKTGSIMFGCSQTEPECIFFVRDTGIGIPREKLDSIFDRFVQVDSSYSSGYEGSGLGLSITKGYVELLGGKLWVESTEGKGSTFYFSLPNALLENTSTAKEQPLHVPLMVNVKHKILVAEDDPTSMLLLNSLLSTQNLMVYKATNGKEAIEIFEENPDINLILMDIKMPVMDGFQAAKLIKQSHPNTPIIAQSAFALTHEKEQFSSVFDDYLTKPIEVNNFNILINKYLSKEKLFAAN